MEDFEKIEEEKAIDIMSIKKNETETVLERDVSNRTLIRVKELPSEFKGYPKDIVISYEPIKLDELEALNPTNDIDPTRAVAMLLNAIECPPLKPEDLYYWDVMYIGIQRKLQAFGNVEGIKYEYCPKCGNIVSKRFKYTDLDFKQMAAPALPMKMVISGQQVECSPISIKSFLQFNVEEGELGILARQIKNMPYEQAYKLVTNAIGPDIKKLRFIDKQLDYGMKPFIVECDGEVTTKNPKFDPSKPESKSNLKKITKTCGEKVVLEVRSPFEVVFPEDIFDGDNDFEVQYG